MGSHRETYEPDGASQLGGRIANQYMNRSEKLKTYLEEIERYQPLSAEEEVELAMRIKDEQDEEARHEFAHANLQLVVSIARKYVDHLPKDISLMDVIQEGNVGLFRAIDKFDYQKGFRFKDYAPWWIRKRITEYLEPHLPKGRIEI